MCVHNQAISYRAATPSATAATERVAADTCSYARMVQGASSTGRPLRARVAGERTIEEGTEKWKGKTERYIELGARYSD